MRVIAPIRLRLAILAAVVAFTIAAPARAQTYVHYSCTGGTEFDAAFFERTRAAFIQIDGKSLNLPKRISSTGARYAKDGVTFWVKRQRVTLKRGGKTVECTAR